MFVAIHKGHLINTFPYVTEIKTVLSHVALLSCSIITFTVTPKHSDAISCLDMSSLTPQQQKWGSSQDMGGLVHSLTKNAAMQSGLLTQHFGHHQFHSKERWK
jgi:hypothetical protein